ncbi:MAG: nucleotidyltransferase family protein [Magnetococcales bacterium]|nr:nucleotidyltransferase family protein [Magnetococcales bacterium]
MTKQAVILAGGQGTRLGSLTMQTPKPMLPVAGRPFLEYLVWNLYQQGIQDIILSCGYLGEQIVNHFNKKRWGKLTIRGFIEPNPLGTGGALRYLSTELESHFFLLNGDTLFDIQYLDLPLPSSSPSCVMALRQVPNASRYGQVEMQEKRIVRFLEKAPNPHPGLINAGVCWMNRDLVAYLPEGISSIERDLFPRLANENQLFGKIYENYFIDIGIINDYDKANLDLTSISAQIPKTFGIYG